MGIDIDIKEMYNSIGDITYSTDYNHDKAVMNYGTNCETWHKDFKNIKEMLNFFIKIDVNNDLNIYISNSVYSFSYDIAITLTIDKQKYTVTYNTEHIKSPSIYEEWSVSIEPTDLRTLSKYANFKYKCMKRNEIINEILDI